jgi:hypothetical protein
LVVRGCDDLLFLLWWLVALRGLRRGEVVALLVVDGVVVWCPH